MASWGGGEVPTCFPEPRFPPESLVFLRFSLLFKPSDLSSLIREIRPGFPNVGGGGKYQRGELGGGKYQGGGSTDTTTVLLMASLVFCVKSGSPKPKKYGALRAPIDSGPWTARAVSSSKDNTGRQPTAEGCSQ